MNNSIFNSLPWWMNPKYPMGRRDYFVTSLGVALAALIPAVAFYSLFVYLTNSKPDAEEFGTVLGMVIIIPAIPLMLRRIKACQFPVPVFWCYIAIAFAIGFAEVESKQVDSVIGVLDFILNAILLFAPNKVEPVTSNPNA